MGQEIEKLVRLGIKPPRSRPNAAARSPQWEGSGPRVYIETYGCQMNVSDTDMISGLLADADFSSTRDPDHADVILINTCAVREKAEERVFRRARELSVHKRKRNGVVLAVVGCMAEHLKERLAAAAPQVDVIAGPDSYRRLPELLTTRRQLQHNPKALPPATVDVRLDRNETYEGVSRATATGAISGFITIQRGCDKFCSFCVVPFTRGRERGVAPREILRQARELAEAGLLEVTLLGQTVNSYHYEDVTFAELLRSVATVDGIERIRFTSPYPLDFSADVIAAIAEETKICPYVHLPVQSGSDPVLERMRRGYTVADFRKIVSDLRAAVPEIAISTDILSGFSGETESCHQETLALMSEIRFDSAFMFSYSERDLTFAAKKLADDVAPDIKKRRLQEIIALQEQISTQVFASRVGRIERVLVHGHSKRDHEQMVGRTPDFKSVIILDANLHSGDLVDVVIERSTMATLFGRLA